MGKSSLLGVDQADASADGFDSASLGPSDSSDSGSDMVGVSEPDIEDPSQPVDVALKGSAMRSSVPRESLSGASSDSAGTGERRSAGADAGRSEGADISADHVFDPNDENAEDGDSDLAVIDQAEAGEVLDDEIDDPEADDAFDNAAPHGR